ncbi:MAG: hypothetical protein JXA10_02845 [Anaerolineae bacterium]|nr:hypothetical protein [Anaerolineae bacterium]
MYQKDAEVLFPTRVIESLHPLRGPKWQQLVEHVLTLPENNPDVLAFNLVMIRLNGCLSCQADSFRAMRGCTICARQSLIRFKGSDDNLVDMWETARSEILRWQRTGEPPLVER